MNLIHGIRMLKGSENFCGKGSTQNYGNAKKQIIKKAFENESNAFPLFNHSYYLTIFTCPI